tara:strand:- start:340 stop:1053 length:714 start_codon:yes stop_codon:yes gene_type:complete
MDNKKDKYQFELEKIAKESISAEENQRMIEESKKVAEEFGKFGDEIRQKSKEIEENYKKISKFVEEFEKIKNNMEPQKNINDDIIIKYIDNELDIDQEKIIRKLIDESPDIKKRYEEFLKLKTMIAETYVSKAKEPMPEKTKALIDSYKKKRHFKLFGIAGLSSLAAFGWLGTISLGTYQIMGIMAVTTAPTAVFRSAPAEVEIDFEILEISEDNCVTFIYDLPDATSAITKNICLD